MIRRALVLALLVAALGCSTAGVRHGEYAFGGSAIGDAQATHCEQTVVLFDESSPVRGIVHTRCTQNKGGHLAASAWDAIYMAALTVYGWFVR